MPFDCPSTRRWRGLFYRLACGKYSITGNNHCRLIATLIVPNRIFANTARTKTTHAIGSRLVDDDRVYTVIEERAINLNSGLTSNLCGSVELAVLQFNSLSINTSLVINQHRLTGTVKGTILEKNLSCAICPNIVVSHVLFKYAVIKFYYVSVKELLAGDCAIPISELTGMLEAAVIFSTEIDGYALKAYAFSLIYFVLHINYAKNGAVALRQPHFIISAPKE